MTVEDSDALDRCSALFTVAAYVVANLEDMLPREGDYPDDGGHSTVGSAAVPNTYHGMSILIAVALQKMIWGMI